MKEKNLERCGFCGSFFRGENYVSADELNATDPKVLEEAPLGYCSNAQAESYENEPRYVTRDMAIDAGYPEMEGERY